MVVVSGLAGTLVGALITAGIVMAVIGWRGVPVRERPARRLPVSAAVRRQIGAGLIVGLVVGVVTRWPVAAVAAAAAVAVGPNLIGGQRSGAAEVARLEALAAWVESMRDSVCEAVSLEQAIATTAATADQRLEAPLGHLQAMLRTRTPMPEALTRFADDLDDPGADLVVAALILNAQRRGPGLAACLWDLATHTREELEQRQLVEARRAALHRSARIIIGVVATFAGGLVVLASDYVAPYSSPVGQLVLVGIGVVFAAAFLRLRKLAEYDKPARFLSSSTTAGAVL